MAFRFSENDFERFVKVAEHGGRHVWHDLQDAFQEEFSRRFKAAPWRARGDWLELLWFAPTGVRSNWSNQAQFFLARNLGSKHLTFGLTVECPTAADVEKGNLDPDCDCRRLREHLDADPEFVSLLEDLLSTGEWSLQVSVWDKAEHHPGSLQEMKTLIAEIPPDQGWQLDVSRTLSAEEAVEAGDSIADLIMNAYRTVRPLWECVIPENARRYLHGESIDLPAEVSVTPTQPRGELTLDGYFASCGFRFSPLSVATFFTALQTKGFVILSGLSGTGKTKLAQHFAALLGFSEEAENYLFLPVRPDWRDSRPLLGYYNPLTEHYETSELLRFILDARKERAGPSLERITEWLRREYATDSVKGWCERCRDLTTRLGRAQGHEIPVSDLRVLWLAQENGIASVGQAAPLRASDEQLREVTEIVRNEALTAGQRTIQALQYLRGIPGNKTPWARTLRAVGAFDLTSTAANHTAVRSLLEWLGYPRRFDFPRLVDSGDADGIDDALRFLREQVVRLAPTEDPHLRALTPWLMWEYLRAPTGQVSAREAPASPFFVVLDEMNLSRVEYYFADFLSVLESGREEGGITREAIRLHSFPANAKTDSGQLIPTDTDGRYVPPDLRLPPNLYFVGTVNVDETTHAFSPKVLDRAFTIEMTVVDLGGYPPAMASPPSDDDVAALAAQLRPIFTREARYACVDKAEVSRFARAHPDLAHHLAALNARLEPYDLHFGYRVFDEVMAFCANAEANTSWADVGGVGAAFDCAVLMKVLPKFHGPRSKLERPLRTVLAWAWMPDDADGAAGVVEDRTRDVDACVLLRDEIKVGTYREAQGIIAYPQTALKTVRMLQALHMSGFASFA